MVDILVRLDTAYGEAGTYVPKMAPDMWGLTLDEVTGAPSGNHPEDGEPIMELEGGRAMLGGHPVDRTDEEKTWDSSKFGSKTGGSREAAAKKAASRQRAAADEAQDHTGTVGDGKVPKHLQTTEAETAGQMTQKPIQAPALGPDGDGNVANDPLPGSEDEVIAGATGATDNAGNPMSTTVPGDARRGHSDNASPQDKHAAELADQTKPIAIDGDNDADKASSKPVPKDLPSKSALMAMGKDELVAYARHHQVKGAANLTKEEIIEDLHGRG